MNKLAFLIHILLFLITVSSAFPANDGLADLFYKRHHCSCAAAYADFDSSHSSSGPFRGFVAFSQDETGCTTIFGAFNQGFVPDCTYDFLIKNGCSGTEYKITSDLNVEITNDGGTKAFSHKFDNINLNCQSDGLLSCGKSHYKRQGSSSSSSSGGGSSSFIIEYPDNGQANKRSNSTDGKKTKRAYALIKPVSK
ncbi:unnamed protein product [Rhizophagus irregularis]|uniref:Uncharacterized protein n=1 Tax=Rhizophagus irregularis TaxID=588596 RepID=A0A2I1H231_9GLOM|nr:hypothetical protein RhiirA4_447444 [Rhizophagus irregularis]CAB4441710.1 unnamed protein product [Rhizophagus irregularis]